MNRYLYSLPTILVTLLMMLVTIAISFLFLCKCLPIKLLHKLLRKLDILDRGPDDSDEKPQSTLHGHEVPMISVLMFTNYLSSICLTIGAAFINTLFVHTTTSCNPKVDCFMVDSSASLDLFKQPLYNTPVNCSNLTDDSFFVCYKFQFDLSNALAVAGGLITIAKLTINITTSVLFWLMNRQTENRKIIVMLIIISSIVMLLLIIFIALLMPQIFAQEVTTVFFFTDGIMLPIQLLVFLSTAAAATLAVAHVYCPTFINKLSSVLFSTLCCKCKYYRYIKCGHKDLHTNV